MLPRYHASRRHFFRATACTTAMLWVPGVLAEELAITPRQTEGPFYPDRLPLDTDNDLIVVNNSLTPAVGKITHLTGRVLSRQGSPLRGLTVEIWQADSSGAYLHRDSMNGDRRDKNFQGFGRFLTSSRGEYYFRTIRPVPYPGRTPHIHVMVRQGDRKLLTTQLYIAGEEQNGRDGVYRGLGDQSRLVTAEFRPLPQSRAGELAASLDLVLGVTPEDPVEG